LEETEEINAIMNIDIDSSVGKIDALQVNPCVENENRLKLKQLFIKYYFLPERLTVPEVERKLNPIVNNSQFF